MLKIYEDIPVRVIRDIDIARKMFFAKKDEHEKKFLKRILKHCCEVDFESFKAYLTSEVLLSAEKGTLAPFYKLYISSKERLYGQFIDECFYVLLYDGKHNVIKTNNQRRQEALRL